MKKVFLLLFALLTVVTASAQMRTVKGQVVYAGDGEPLAGATILPVGGSVMGTATDVDGHFTISVDRSVSKIKVSYVGMSTQEVDITDAPMLIKLHNSENNLDEVMVVAYGTAKKSAYTGSASVVNAAEIQDRLVTDVTKVLAGTVAGVQLQSTTGQPGSEPTVRIRGVGSINASTSPLYVVDGIPYDGGMRSINPQDVESITVLKDAASAALYGARGANGVILVTTKKGRAGEAKITFDARWGANSRMIPNYDVITDPDEYVLDFYNSRRNYVLSMGYDEDFAHNWSVNGINAGPGTSNIFGYQMYTIPEGESLILPDGTMNPNATLGYKDATNYFIPDDWQKGTYHDGFRQEYNLSVSGGTDRFNYMVSASYLTDEGIIKESNYDRLATRATAEYQAKKWLKIGTNLSYTYEAMNSPQSQQSTGQSGNASYVANFIAPIYPMFIRDVDGNIVCDPITGNKLYDFGMRGTGTVLPGSDTKWRYSRSFLAGGNPTGTLIYDKSEYLYDVFNGKWFAQLTPIDGLTLTGTAGYYLRNRRFNYLANSKYGQLANYGGQIQQLSTRTSSINLQGLANYRKTFAEVHDVDILVGYESYELQVDEMGGEGMNIFNNNNHTLSNIIDEKDVYGSQDNYATRGIFGRVNYSYDGRYYGSVSYRRDASSRFHPSHRWGNFWSVSAAWDISKEKFMEDFVNVDMLKFKASFGQQGNDGIGNDYAYINQYNQAGADGVWSVGTLYYKGNPDLTWETSNSFNTGFDFSFWQGKLSGTLEYFLRQTSDMLYYRPTGPSLGFSSMPMNVGSMRNSGLELELIYRPIETRHITWDVNFNLTYVRNKVIKLAPELNGTWISGSRIYEEGKSMYQLYLVKYAGVDPENGDALYWAMKSDGTEEATSDYNLAYSGNAARGYVANRQSTGNILPPVYGGFGTSLSAYGVDFSIQCGYQLGGKIMDYGYQLLMHGANSSDKGTAMHVDSRNAWTPENPNTDVPRLDWGAQYTNLTSDRWLEKSDYFSINNITLGYTLPAAFTQKFGIEAVRVYGAADNVALWSARKGLDPRQSYVQSAAGYYASLRTVSGGIKVTF